MSTNESVPSVVGAAMVIGGGVAGMQAALDLAESGIKVYLVESSPAIGGKMAQLDKTFPTNDCAMCTISPRLVECARHLNIHIMTNSEVRALEGQPGSFEATVEHKPRYVDVSKCTGCGDCERVCPVTIPSRFDEGLAEKRAIYKPYPQAVPNAYAIQRDGRAPCKDACPAGCPAQGYVALLREGRIEDAYRVIKDYIPFPGICGRICNHRCEDACNRAALDAPVAIASLKRYIADRVYASPRRPISPIEPTWPERIAVVGSGPAGMTAAQDLVRAGYRVTVFEALPVPGGMLRVGVPEYRLPTELVQREIDDIVALGVELKCNCPVDNLDSLFEQGYSAVFLAIGAHRGRKLPIPGADLQGVLLNTDVLRKVRLGEKVELGDRVLVLGGGNVAMDVARTVRRLGVQEVHVACVEPRDKMPAHDYEVAAAEAEGIVVHPSRSFNRVVEDHGRAAGVECSEVIFFEFQPDGRLKLEAKPGSEHVLPADTVIFAIGQAPDLGCAAGLETSRRGTLVVKEETLETSRPGVFAGGDVVTGTTFVVDAIAAGHRAARSIARYLRGQPLWTPEPKPPVVKLSKDEARERVLAGISSAAPRATMPELPPSDRVRTFAESDLGFTDEQAMAEAKRCLSCGVCSECLECERVCQAKALVHTQQTEFEKVRVGAVIVAAGYDLYDASHSDEFGFGRYPNVVTAMQFERILSASGPTQGHVVRPSDHREPRRIAFLQCVGSRDREHQYCSSVCCMYATKEAILAREHLSNQVDTQVFLMDMRAFGKGFDAYFERAKREYGVKYTRCRPSSVKEVPGSRNLLVRYETEDGELREEEFDLVVLSTGMVPSQKAKILAESLGIELNRYGFCQVDSLHPVDTSRPGVFACGSFTEPRDISDSVTQGSAAAARVLELLSPARGTLAKPKQYVPEKNVEGEEPRVGVFICHCGSNIAGVVDVKRVAERTLALPGVAYAQTSLYTCSEDTQKIIREKIEEMNLNRVVVASCTPRTHEPLFQETCREAGLNRYLFEMANIRDQCSWVHSKEPERATLKAEDLVRMAVARAKTLEPLRKHLIAVNQSALVIGGGLAGMTAALAIARQGFPVSIVEKEPELGGNLRHLRYDAEGRDLGAYLGDLITKVRANSLIDVFTSSRVLRSSGFVGNYKTVVDRGGREQALEHGVTIVATGGSEYRGREYLLGQDDRVITQLELEEAIAERPQMVAKLQSVVMIQCVGPSPEKGGYCSRTCCSSALKNALKIKELNPQASVVVLFKEMRTYGFREEQYTEARRKGVLFLRYTEEQLPAVEARNDGIWVRARDMILREDVEVRADLLALSMAIVPSETAGSLANTLKLPLTREGFFLEAHIKLRPVDFASEGLFVCGTAHYPKFIDETITQALAVAARASAILGRSQMEVGGIVSQVDPNKCAACLTCVRVCPYNVPRINEEGVAEIEVAQCQGCGTCVAECPAKAIQLMHYKDAQVMVKEDALLLGVS